jgi:endo-1,4-beta-mannosidase
LSEPFRLGVNYWPRRKAMYWWSNFDAGEVREEFALIREIGMDVVRIFLLWDAFQPTPDTVDRTCLENLVKVCDIAAESKLGLDITFFTGHMSGPNWSPRWLLDSSLPIPSNGGKQVISGGKITPGGYRNMYTDPTAIPAARLMLDTVVKTLKDHPGVWMWNLGNEPDLFAVPPDANTGRLWTREMVSRIRRIDSKRPITYGLHVPSLQQDNGFRVDQIYDETDVAVMHAYPMYCPWAREPLDPDFVPFTCALVTALCGKPALMEEFGGCTAAPGEASYIWEWTAYGEPRKQFMASEDDLAAYLAAVLPKLVEVGATGALMWCFADYIAELWDKPPCDEARHERFFGVVRPDGTLKPHAQVIKDFANTAPMVQPASRTVSLDISPDEFYQNPTEHAIRFYQKYLADS